MLTPGNQSSKEMSSQAITGGFPGDSDSKESACNLGDLGSIPGLGRCPEEERLPTPVLLPGEFHGQRSLAGYKMVVVQE